MNNVKIYASIIDDTTKEQITQLSESKAYKDCTIRVMPDCHSGKGCTIGSVIQYSDKVIPNTVGVDIGCGMGVLELGKIDIDLQKFDEVINEFIPTGFNIRETPFFPVYHTFTANISNWKYIECSIGTLGGGNHFIELDVDDEGNKYLVVHTGSRNLGVQVCEYWQNKAIENFTDDSSVRKELIDKLKAEGRQRDIQNELRKLEKPSINKELAYLEGENLDDYIHDMQGCQIYAELNRRAIIFTVYENMWRGLPQEYNRYFSTIHNYIDIPNKVIRKGAISAKKGEKVIIPMNMRDGSLICIGKGNEDWLNSAPHGAGRIMSRNQAKECLNLTDFKDSMEGIYTTSVCDSTIDEAPMVYKPIEQLIKDIEPTVEIVKIIKPIYNFKAK